MQMEGGRSIFDNSWVCSQPRPLQRHRQRVVKSASPMARPSSDSSSSTALAPVPRHSPRLPSPRRRAQPPPLQLESPRPPGADWATIDKAEASERRPAFEHFERRLEEECEEIWMNAFTKELAIEASAPLRTPKKWRPPRATSPQSKGSPVGSPASMIMSTKSPASELEMLSPSQDAVNYDPQLVAAVLNRVLPVGKQTTLATLSPRGQRSYRRTCFSQVDGRLSDESAKEGRIDARDRGDSAVSHKMSEDSNKEARSNGRGKAGSSGDPSSPAASSSRGVSGARATSCQGPRVTRVSCAVGRTASASPRSPKGDSSVMSPLAHASERSFEVSEVVAFRSALTRKFGNLARAILAMRSAVNFAFKGDSGPRPSLPSVSLTKQEFEWCVTSFLLHGDRLLANRLFASLDRNQDGLVNIDELTQPSARTEGLLSIVEFRRRVLDQHRSLWQAFKDVEDYLESQLRQGRSSVAGHGRAKRALPLKDFVKAAAFLGGLEPHQATHFFSIMDADSNGSLTLDEFMDALSKMPPDVLLQDFRQRLLMKHTSISAALQEITAISDSPMDVHAARLGRQAFGTSLARLGVADIEAGALFQIIDSDASGDVSLGELLDALREVAPAVNLEAFWQRFDAEWPEVSSLLLESCTTRQQAEVAAARSKAGMLLAEMLPVDLLQTCAMAQSPSSERKQQQQQEPELVLHSITADMFDSLAARLDIPRANASTLFEQLLTAVAALSRKAPAVASPAIAQLQLDGTARLEFEAGRHEVGLEDFAELLELWNSNPTSPAYRKAKRIVASAQTAVAALKAECNRPCTAKASEAEAKQAPASARTVPMKAGKRPKRPILPWCSIAAAPRLSPLAPMF